MCKSILFSLLALSFAGCSSGSSSPSTPSVEIPAAAITVTGVSFDKDYAVWQKKYSFVVSFNSTHDVTRNVTVKLKSKHSYHGTITTLHSQSVSASNGTGAYVVYIGTSDWEYGYDGRPQNVTITYTATIDGIDYSKDVTLIGRFVSFAG